MATRKGHAQVEPNHMSGMVTGQILAQLPTAVALGDVIENGRFAKYDYAAGEVNLTGKGEWMMIYNEEKKYDERKQGHKDFAMIRTNYTDGEIVPRLFSVLLGDIWTTNAFGVAAVNGDADQNITLPGQGDEVFVDPATGYLTTVDPKVAGQMVFECVKVYTLADGQAAVKLMRVK